MTMQIGACRFSGEIRVQTVGDNRLQQDYLKAKLVAKSKDAIPPYLEAQESVIELLKTTTVGQLRAIVKKYTSRKLPLTLTLGHNLKSATMDYGENPKLRGQLHQALAETGADFIDTDGVLHPLSFKLQLRDQFLKPFGLPLEREIVKLLFKKKLTMATAESATGGLISSRLTDIRGSSHCVNHNIITYSNEAKTKALAVDADFLAENGPYNRRTAADMATGIRQATGAKIGLSITGLAGCNRWGDDFAGAAFSGLDGLSKEPIVKRVQVDAALHRTMKKQLFSEYALTFLKQYILGVLPKDPD